MARQSVRRRESIAAQVPIELYEHARHQLLANEPMIGQTVPGGSAAQALTAEEIDALESVGLSTTAWRIAFTHRRRPTVFLPRMRVLR